MQLRDYQEDAVRDIRADWYRGVNNTLYTLSTGGGKTVIFSDIIRNEPAPSIAIAHRQELVSQMSLSLARNQVRHRIVAPDKVIKLCINIQMQELGHHFFNTNASAAVAGVDTLVRRKDQLSKWLPQVKLWVMDEAHHVLRKNKWGKAVDMFPNARGLGVTATPIRADGHGLGLHADGVFQSLIEGPDMRDLINRGSLTDYRIFAPPSDIDMDDEKAGASGDWSNKQLKNAARKSHIVGDVVDHYMRIAEGKLGLTFATDVETAGEIKMQYIARGIPAEILSAKTPDRERAEILRRLRNRQILQLVNVDICGEGFDLPAIEVVSMARPTQSYSLYAQQFGRALRPLEGKEYAIIIDHVGNVIRHGLPDKPRIWTLNARDKSPRYKNPDDDIPLRYCIECTAPYEKVFKQCPYCGADYIPASRSKPEYVDGDLTELDPEVLKEMRGEKARVDEPAEAVKSRMEYAGALPVACAGAAKNHRTRQVYQQALRESMSWWAAYQKKMGRDDSEAYSRFYHNFGIDVLGAQVLGKNEATTLANKINKYLGEVGR